MSENFGSGENSPSVLLLDPCPHSPTEARHFPNTWMDLLHLDSVLPDQGS